MDKMKMTSRNVIGGNVEKIAALFPHCVTERLDKDGKPEMTIDFDKLRAELSSEILEAGEERYQFTWPDKRAASRLANEATTKTLRPYRDESVDFDNSENLYIEGDNLDVLKVLRETYLGKVKMIYIDPPYNTGNDFVYNDDFAQDKDTFEQQNGLFDDEGNQTIDPMQRNTEANGRFHTDWLNMMYPRLKVARDLLTDDGVIFISIDDNEVNNNLKICDEIFGVSNRVGILITINNPRGRQSDTFFATVHEYLLCYSKNKNFLNINGMFLNEDQKSEYSLTDGKGKYRLLGLRQRGVASLREDRPDMFFPFYINNQTNEISLEKKVGWEMVIPKKSDGREGRWMWGKQKCKNEISRLVPKFISKRKEFDIYVKDYLNKEEKERTRKFKTVLDEKTFNNQNGTQEVKALLEGDFMSFPKSMDYIKTICLMGSSEDSIILDFFSGSATTAHAVMKLNAEDGGHRKFIMVQLPEITDEKSEARKAGYETICEIGKERIRRAGKKIIEELKQERFKLQREVGTRSFFEGEEERYRFNDEQRNKKNERIEEIKNIENKLDIGFRVLKLDSSNMEDVYYTPVKFEPGVIDMLIDNIKPERTSEDLLFQVMLDLGIELSAKIERKKINGKEVYSVDDDYLIACFDKDVDEKTIEEMAKLLPTHLVIRDASAANDNVLDNFEQIIALYSNEKKINTHIL